MIYSIAVCDDCMEDAKRIAASVQAWSDAAGRTMRIAVFPSAEAFLFAYGENNDFDILLLDVEMDGMSGLELAKRIRADAPHVEIVFITSHFELAGEGYEVDALHYLVKPVEQQRLHAVLDKATVRLSTQPQSVILSCEGETLRLYETDILYAEAFLHYVSIHTRRGEYRIKEKISAFEAQLGSSFFRIHRSYIVSLAAVVKITRTEVELCSGARLPLSRNRYDELNRAFIQYH